MKRKKLSLAELRVTSFVTSLERNGVNTIKGGSNAASIVGEDNCNETQDTLADEACDTGAIACNTENTDTRSQNGSVGLACSNVTN